jgi:hypothetical protein
MQKIEMNIAALANSEPQSNNFIVILKENEGDRRLPVVIGGFEAQAIAIAIEKIRPSRPLSHDLFKNVLDQLSVELEEVIISDLRNNIFYATLVCRKWDGSVLNIDSRTSDAIALAVRFTCPIYAYDFILDEAGVVVENESANVGDIPRSEEGNIKGKNEEELRSMLSKALEKEDYETAAKIRDELKRLEG